MDRVSAFIFIECMMTQVHQKSHSLRIPHIYNWPSATPANSSGHYFTERNGTERFHHNISQNRTIDACTPQQSNDSNGLKLMYISCLDLTTVYVTSTRMLRTRL